MGLSGSALPRGAKDRKKMNSAAKSNDRHNFRPVSVSGLAKSRLRIIFTFVTAARRKHAFFHEVKYDLVLERLWTDSVTQKNCDS